MGYKSRLETDLDGWIDNGLVPATSRAPILASVVESPRLGASAALAVIGGLLLGAAVIAFVGANWSAIPRVVRFVLIIGLFLSAAAAAAWVGKERPLTRNIILLVASLVYAAAIGLTGQIFDIAGDPEAALHAAGMAALLLALAGRSSGAAIAAMALLALGDTQWTNAFQAGWPPLPWLLFGAPVGVGLAWVWRSKPLAHAAALSLALAGVLTLIHMDMRERVLIEQTLLAVSVIYGGLAFSARSLAERGTRLAAIGYGWWSWAALGFFGVAGLSGTVMPGFLHRGLWLALAAGAVALGMHDRRSGVTAAGVVALAGAMAAVIFDLGLGLMAAAGVFALVALAALAGGWFLRRRVGA